MFLQAIQRSIVFSGTDLEKIAREHALAGGAIMNVIRYASLQALREGGRPLTVEDLLQGIRKEYAKQGKAG
ncbi:hypothetical protein [Sorangium cellulosum]|uniref:Uncharacterized protein n=1 Tax=Sorangium cellulosum TaxID=56 RepID=A0A150QYS0_SORCE|nr:hypothetical protein [Sorangium cellulosum]KYF73137.1 hypothetical protein BE15_04040 [Sorangium cellulosum]